MARGRRCVEQRWPYYFLCKGEKQRQTRRRRRRRGEERGREERRGEEGKRDKRKSNNPNTEGTNPVAPCQYACSINVVFM